MMMGLLIVFCFIVVGQCAVDIGNRIRRVNQKMPGAADFFAVFESFGQRFKTIANLARWAAGIDRVRWDIFGNDAAGSNHTALANRHAVHDNRCPTDPHVVMDRNAFLCRLDISKRFQSCLDDRRSDNLNQVISPRDGNFGGQLNIIADFDVPDTKITVIADKNVMSHLEIIEADHHTPVALQIRTKFLDAVFDAGIVPISQTPQWQSDRVAGFQPIFDSCEH